MQTFLQDFRYSIRQLAKNLGFTITAVISLALGIGATTAVFSVVHAVLINPYPYPAPERMMHLRIKNKAGQESTLGLTGAQLQAIKKSPVVEDAIAIQDWSLILTGRELPEDIDAAYVTSNFFNYCGVPAARGRGLLPSDAIDGQDPQPVAVLSYKFWQRHFGSDAAVLGKTLQLTHKNYTIVGVAVPRFTWDNADVYLPLQITQDPVLSFYAQVRLKPGVSRTQANAALRPLIEEFVSETPKHFPRDPFQFYVVGLNDDFVQRLGGTLSLLFCAVGLLLVIGCGNVSILLLARGMAREHEFAVRAAIGATRRRIIRQLLTEALLLSLSGAVLGVLLAYRGLATIVSLLPASSYPHQASIKINLPVLLFTVGIALVTGILFGLAPALQLSRPQISQVMQSSARKIAGSVRGRTTNSVLIAGQIALTLLMLAGAGAAMGGFLKLMHTPLGYDPRDVMSMGIPVHQGAYKTWAERTAYFEQLLNKAAAVSGVDMAAISSNATPPSNGWGTTIEILGQAARDDQKVRINLVSPGYFPLLRIPVVQGTIWDETQNHNAAPVVVINETLARRYFPNGDAPGHSLKLPEMREAPPYNVGGPDLTGWREIVGVIADKRDDGLRNPILPEAFVPYTVSMSMWTQILVRSSAGVAPLSLLHSIGAQISSVNPDQQVSGDVKDLAHWITDLPEYQQERLVAWLFGAFAVLGLALAAVGLYSVVSYSVVQRTNEFGIRMALGAQRGHVLRIVLASTVMSVASGIAAGLLLAMMLNTILGRWAEGSSRSPYVLLAAILLLSVVAALACALPARRASEVDPMTALRYE
jgi:predicted permease